MVFRPDNKVRKCKYCNKPPKVNYHGIKRKHKGYYKTCGSEECLNRQYNDRKVSSSKSYASKKEYSKCCHCAKTYLKETFKQKWCKECVPDKYARTIMRRYGISRQEYLNMIEISSGKCPICLKRKASAIDHCHKTNKVRGILCNHCNTCLHVIENEAALKRALKYLYPSN